MWKCIINVLLVTARPQPLPSPLYYSRQIPNHRAQRTAARRSSIARDTAKNRTSTLLYNTHTHTHTNAQRDKISIIPKYNLDYKLHSRICHFVPFSVRTTLGELQSNGRRLSALSLWPQIIRSWDVIGWHSAWTREMGSNRGRRPATYLHRLRTSHVMWTPVPWHSMIRWYMMQG